MATLLSLHQDLSKVIFQQLVHCAPSSHSQHRLVYFPIRLTSFGYGKHFVDIKKKTMKTESRIDELVNNSLLYEDAKVVSTKSIPERILMLQSSLGAINSELQLINKSEHKVLLKQGRFLFLVEDRINLLQDKIQEIKLLGNQISNGDLQHNYNCLKDEQIKLRKLFNILNYLETI